MSLTSGLTSLLGIDTNAGTAELQQAIAALQAIGVPNAAQLTLPELQKYVSAGVLTPQQFQAISADPQAYQNIANAADQSGLNAQKAALQQLGAIVQSGGSTPIMQAQLANNLAQTNQQAKAARGGIEEQAQQRGVSGGGLEFINKLMAEQAGAENNHLGAVNAAANNAQLALQALSGQGQLGGQLQGQENAMAQAKAQAAQQIAQYNSQLQSAANQYNTQTANQAQQMNLGNAQNLGNMNTQNANARTQYNAQVPQQIFQDQMSKAGGISNALGNLGQLKQNQAGQENAFLGNLLGAGATVAGGSMAGPAGAMAANQATQGYQNGPGKNVDTRQYSPYGYAHGGEVAQCYAQGGEVHDHRLCMDAGGSVPGDDTAPMMQDSEANDTVPANLSPGEVVLPRSVSQAPNAPEAAAQFVGGIKGQQPMPNFSQVLKMLEDNGLELRLTSSGDSFNG